MCTAIFYKPKNHYLGRTLDLDYHYNEQVVIMPRNFPFPFRYVENKASHFALIGMATVVEGLPLYYDAMNEKGLCMAGLNFPDYTNYSEMKDDIYNIAPFELIPFVLSQCKSVGEAKELFDNINVISENFSEKLPNTPLHYILGDRENCITVECVQEGIKVYANPVGVLSNSPPFPMQMFNLNNYMNLTSKEPDCRLTDELNLHKYCAGMGAIGLPGDNSSQSRFVRAVFNKLNCKVYNDEIEDLTQFFHLLGSVEQIEGTVETSHGLYKSVYTSCCDGATGIYYYKTYGNSQISAVNMHGVNLDKNELVIYNIADKQQINYQN